jgi:hypothetical protein
MKHVIQQIIHAAKIWGVEAGDSHYHDTPPPAGWLAERLRDPTRSHIQVTTGFRGGEEFRKWFIHSKLHAFVNRNRTMVAFLAEPNVDDDACKDRVIETCARITDAWRQAGLTVATDIPREVEAWQKECNPNHLYALR